MEIQTRQERRAGSVSHIAMQTDWFYREETAKCFAVPVVNVVKIILEN